MVEILCGAGHCQQVLTSRQILLPEIKQNRERTTLMVINDRGEKIAPKSEIILQNIDIVSCFYQLRNLIIILYYLSSINNIIITFVICFLSYYFQKLVVFMIGSSKIAKQVSVEDLLAFMICDCAFKWRKRYLRILGNRTYNLNQQSRPLGANLGQNKLSKSIWFVK